MTPTNKTEPVEHRPGKQMDDNIDDLGRRPDGTTQDQPVNPPDDEGAAKKDDSSRAKDRTA
jgi:hypothetical protein